MENFNLLLRNSKISSLQKNSKLKGFVIKEKDPVLVNLGLKKNIIFDHSKQNNITTTIPATFLLTENLEPKYLKEESYTNKLQQVWRLLELKQQKNQLVEGRILSIIKGGYSVGIAGLVAFLPQSQILKTKFPETLIGQLKTFSLLKVDKANNNIIVSRKQAIKHWATEFPLLAKSMTKKQK